MTVLISEHNSLYQDEESQPDTQIIRQQSNGQRCKVEWLPQQPHNPPSLSSAGTKTPDTKPEPSSLPESTPADSATVVDKAEEGQSEGKDKRKKEETLDGGAESNFEGGVEVSPSKQTKAHGSRKTSFMSGAASGGPKAKIGGSVGDVSAAGGSNWLMNGLSSLRAHRRTTSSGEKLKDSLKDSTLSLKEASLKDLQRDSDEDSPKMSLSHRAVQQSHRLSAYDNVAPSTLSLPSDTSTIWTSYEISLAEPQGGDKAPKQEKPQEVLDNKNALDHSGAEDNLVLTNEDLTKMLTELKQELKKQRSSYETCIRKYE